MSTRSTYGYSKVTIQCTGSPSMRKVWDCDDIPGNTSCCRKVAKDKNANFLWVFWQIMGDMMMPTKLRDLSQQYQALLDAEFSQLTPVNPLKGTLLQVIWSEEGHQNALTYYM